MPDGPVEALVYLAQPLSGQQSPALLDKRESDVASCLAFGKAVAEGLQHETTTACIGDGNAVLGNQYCSIGWISRSRKIMCTPLRAIEDCSSGGTGCASGAAQSQPAAGYTGGVPNTLLDAGRPAGQ